MQQTSTKERQHTKVAEAPCIESFDQQTPLITVRHIREIVKEGEFVPLNFSISVNLLWFMSSWGDGRMDEINSTLKEQVKRLFYLLVFPCHQG